MVFQNVLVILLLLFSPFIDCDVDQQVRQHQIVDISFRPALGGTIEHAEEIAVSDGKADDLMRLSFNAFDDDIDILVHRSLDPELHGTMVEVRRINNSEVRNFNAEYYEFNNATTNVQGYRNTNGQFQGFVMTRNCRTLYIVEPARVYYPDDVTVISKSIVHRQDEGIVENSEQYYYYYYYQRRNYSHSDGFGKSNRRNLDNKRSTRIFSFGIDMFGDEEMHRVYGESTVAQLYVYAKAADVILRRTQFINMRVRLIPLRIFVLVGTPMERYFNPNLTMEHALMRFREYYPTPSSAAFFFTYKPYRGEHSGSAFGKAICRNNSHAIIRAVDEKGNHSSPGSVLRTFSHLIGHLMGAEHDTEDCYREPYKYVMHGSRGSIDDKYFLDRFSPCSIRSISEHLERVVPSKLCRHKLVEYPTCGNAIREEGEDCDCGGPDICEYVDKCCERINLELGNQTCKYRDKTERACAKDDVCCNDACTIEKTGKLCDSDVNGCIVRECDGVSKDCSELKKIDPDSEVCYGRRENCTRVLCGASFCERNYKTWQCRCGDAAGDCRFCCWDKGSSSCLPAKFLGGEGFEDLFLVYGKKCGKRGTCDASGICVEATTEPALGKSTDTTPCHTSGNCTRNEAAVGTTTTNATFKAEEVGKMETWVYALTAVPAGLLMMIGGIAMYTYVRDRNVPESMEPIHPPQTW